MKTIGFAALAAMLIVSFAHAGSRGGSGKSGVRRAKAAARVRPVAGQASSGPTTPGTMSTKTLNEKSAASTHGVEAGAIGYEEGKGQNLTNHKGLFQGPKDKQPNPNPGAGTASGRTAITPND